MNKLLIIIITVTLLISSGFNKKYEINHSPSEIITMYNIDIDSKSIKGWLRILYSEEKCKDYNLNMSEKDKKIIIKYIKDLENKKIKKYSRGIE
jgi:hypothetical protein